jgi:hypothetical protein
MTWSEARGFEAIAADVLRVVRAGVVLAERHDEGLVSSIVASSGLSREGVVHALDVALEREATMQELRLLVSRVRPAEAVTVVLAANVFTASVRAVALALAASERVFVRPSRRDPAFAQALVETLADSRVTCVSDLVPRGGVVHAYGHDATMLALALETGVPVWAHGAGLGAALVSRRADVRAASALLAEDMIVFDQRGCLSPRVAFVVGDLGRAEAFGSALVDALEEAERRVPCGPFSPAERAAVLAARDVACMCGDVVGAVGRMVAVLEPDGAGLPPLFPPGRHITVVGVPDEATVVTRLAAFGRAVVAVGADDASFARRVAPPWARVAPLGQLQRPRLDGPVDLRDVWLHRP